MFIVVSVLNLFYFLKFTSNFFIEVLMVNFIYMFQYKEKV